MASQVPAAAPLDWSGIYLTAAPAAALRDAVATLPPDKTATLPLRVGPLPEWVARSPNLCRATGLHGAMTLEEARRAVAPRRIEVVSRAPVDPLDYRDSIESDFLGSGVSLGCCGALANPEVVRAGATQLCGVLERLTLRVVDPPGVVG